MKDQLIGILFFALLALWIIIALRCGKKARLKRQRKELLTKHAHLIDAKVRLTKGQRFDCPRCGGTVQCRECRLHRI